MLLTSFLPIRRRRARRESSAARRPLLLQALDRSALLGPAYRLYQAVQSARVELKEGRLRADGLAVPPARLRTVVAGTPDLAWFLESGRLQATMIREALERHGPGLGQGGRLLDFGCGCGRVTRHWSGLDRLEIHGSDYNPRLVRWCASNLRFARFSVNRLGPPLEYGSGMFDAVYGISVLTHLPQDLGHAWIDELSRILRPGALLLLTTHGDSYLGRLDSDERDRYLAGEPVVRWPGVAGTNLCTAFHPEAYVRERLAPHLELLEFLPEGGAAGSPSQDLVVFRKPAETQRGDEPDRAAGAVVSPPA